MIEYITKSVTVWFMGFFPLSEIIIAVPAGIALELGYSSVVIWAVFGNFVPVLMLNYAYDRLQRIERARRWLNRLSSDRLHSRVNRYGLWAVLIATPWVGVWAMTVTARTMGMRSGPLLVAAFTSITAYAIIVAALIAVGSDVVAG